MENPSAQFSSIHVVAPLVKVDMSLFSVCQPGPMAALTFKTGQEDTGKKKNQQKPTKNQQPLLKQSDAKCHRTKI